MIKRTNRSVWCIAVTTALLLMTVLLLFIMTDGAKVAWTLRDGAKQSEIVAQCS